MACQWCFKKSMWPLAVKGSLSLVQCIIVYWKKAPHPWYSALLSTEKGLVQCVVYRKRYGTVHCVQKKVWYSALLCTEKGLAQCTGKRFPIPETVYYCVQKQVWHSALLYIGKQSGTVRHCVQKNVWYSASLCTEWMHKEQTNADINI